MIEERVLIPNIVGNNLHGIHYICSEGEDRNKSVKPPIIIMCHGFLGDKYEWGRFPETAKSLNREGYDALIFDFSGYGENKREPVTLTKLANDLENVFNWVKNQGYSKIAVLGLSFGGLTSIKAHIIGWSVGGMIAQHFAIKYPERVNKLILINTTAAWPEEKSGLELYKNGQIARYEARLKDPVKTFFDAAKMGFSRNFLKLMKEDPEKKFHGLFSAEDLIKKSTINPATPQDIINQTHALGTHNVLDRLHLINSGTLIICAEKDRQMPKLVNLKIHEGISNSKFIVLEGVGHTSPQEKAPEVNQLIVDFLKE